jgi:hypothetical protein
MSHLIQYDEELAQKLNNEPADYIPLVRGHLLCAKIHPLTSSQVRSRSTHMHTTHPLPLTQRRRSRAFQITTQPSAPPPLLRLADLHPRSHSDKRVSPRPHSWYRHRCQHPLLKSYQPPYRVQKLPQRGSHRSKLWLQRHHTPTSLQQTQGS